MVVVFMWFLAFVAPIVRGARTQPARYGLLGTLPGTLLGGDFSPVAVWRSASAVSGQRTAVLGAAVSEERSRLLLEPQHAQDEGAEAPGLLPRVMVGRVPITGSED